MLFKVPRHYFEKSSGVFGDLFTLPLGDNEAEGSSDKNPIRLESISHIDFQRLLMIIYPVDTSRITINQEEWTSVLKLSTQWEFEDIRKKAIAELSKIEMSAVDKVMLARSYRVGSWLLDGYMALVKRETTLSFEEAGKLGFETAFRICQQREQTFRNCPIAIEYASEPRRSFEGLEGQIWGAFRRELTESGLSERRRPRTVVGMKPLIPTADWL